MLSVLDIKNNKYLKVWLSITLFCILFSTIYELFSFGVISYNMILMFLYPLLLGAIPSLIFKQNVGRLYNDGVLLLAGASLLRGVFEIYGTTSPYPLVITVMGIILIVVQLVINYRKNKV